MRVHSHTPNGNDGSRTRSGRGAPPGSFRAGAPPENQGRVLTPLAKPGRCLSANDIRPWRGPGTGTGRVDRPRRNALCGFTFSRCDPHIPQVGVGPRRTLRVPTNRQGNRAFGTSFPHLRRTRRAPAAQPLSVASGFNRTTSVASACARIAWTTCEMSLKEPGACSAISAPP